MVKKNVTQALIDEIEYALENGVDNPCRMLEEAVVELKRLQEYEWMYKSLE